MDFIYISIQISETSSESRGLTTNEFNVPAIYVF